ncbi:hypothetical protein I316_05462 [Kwoniella heveanensis BCC8398]|uniref:DUF6534 domain-containing protein n=1 Tax=Kwoniella heveanensis BCC8398 TaxID=1296120 RepID=A0A1B9GP95_9TREE|nr:hypothetical protein I316_05462 [Kwoniella heveanensis BCC8398]
MDEYDIVIATSNNPYPVAPTGYLLGSYLALALYGVHVSQVFRYFGRHRDSMKIRLLVAWIFTLSTLQILIILASSWQYFVGGIKNPSIWGQFWWPLSFQDALIPLMAYTAQLYFGRRAWLLTGKRPWMLWTTWTLATVTFACGVALAITARLWSDDPFVSKDSFHSRAIGIPSQVVAITWMGLSAVTDGCITLLLVWRFRQARNSVFYSTRTLVKKMIALTLETVLLTHIVGGVMCVIFLASPAAHRTKSDIFWVLLEAVTELYALSVVFTINSRPPTVPSTPDSLATDSEAKDGREQLPQHLGQTALDYHVEGYQGSTPFGVRPIAINRLQGSEPGSLADATSTKDGSSRDGTASPFTPFDELQEYAMFSPRPMLFVDGSPAEADWGRGRPTEDLDSEEKEISGYEK